MTEIHDYLRLLFASVGTPHCPNCGQEIRPQTVQQMVDRVMALPAGSRLVLYAPYVRGKKGEYNKQLAQMVKEGFIRARIDGQTIDLQGKLPVLDKQRKHNIDIVVDRLVVKPEIEQRLASSIETALKVGDGLLVLAPMSLPEETLSQKYACIDCGTSLSEITPRLFSFNSPFGACPSCSGLGTHMGVDPDKIIADPERSLSAGAIAPWPSSSKSWRMRMTQTLASELGFSLETPWCDLPEPIRQIILHGSGDKEMTFELQWQALELQVAWQLRRRHPQTGAPPQGDRLRDRVVTRSRSTCRFIPVRACEGRRLRPEALAVTLTGRHIQSSRR